MRKKQRYYNRAKRTQNEHDWKSFKNLRKTFKAKLADAHNKYVLDLLDWPTGDNPPTTSKKFWSELSWGRLFPPSLPCPGGTGIRK